MSLADLVKALGVAMLVLIITIAASFPMVAFYATFIEPAQKPEFYQEAALWIAPWSSYVLGPIVFFLCTFWLSRRRLVSNPMRFAIFAVAFYIVVDLIVLPLAIGIPLASMLTIGMLLTLSSKLIAALAGAHCGRIRNTT